MYFIENMEFLFVYCPACEAAYRVPGDRAEQMVRMRCGRCGLVFEPDLKSARRARDEADPGNSPASPPSAPSSTAAPLTAARRAEAMAHIGPPPPYRPVKPARTATAAPTQPAVGRPPPAANPAVANKYGPIPPYRPIGPGPRPFARGQARIWSPGGALRWSAPPRFRGGRAGRARRPQWADRAGPRDRAARGSIGLPVLEHPPRAAAGDGACRFFAVSSANRTAAGGARRRQHSRIRTRFPDRRRRGRRPATARHVRRAAALGRDSRRGRRTGRRVCTRCATGSCACFPERSRFTPPSGSRRRFRPPARRNRARTARNVPSIPTPLAPVPGRIPNRHRHAHEIVDCNSRQITVLL